MSDTPTRDMAAAENAVAGLQMRPGWIHAFTGGDGVLRARRWDPERGAWEPVAPPACCWDCQITYDPTDPTWAPPPPAPHGGDR